MDEKLFLSALIESADDAIISKNLDGIVTSWNRAAEQIFGYTAEEMIGQPITRIIPPENHDEEPAILARIRRGERIEHYETRRVRKDGRPIDISLTVSPIRDESGTIIGASKIARDITQRKLAEARERDALRRAEAANRMKDEFLTTVSHELRTPLTAILGWSKMFSVGTLDEAGKKKAIEVIQRNAKIQVQLIEDLLDISRIISGKLRIEAAPVQPVAVANAAVDVLRLAADAKDIRVQIIADSNAGPVLGDFQRLQQVVWNLVSNAIKFTPTGGHIQVRVSRVKSHIEISVHDTGIGIRQEFLPYVFNRFSQADSSLTRSFGGLGVGLAITRSIVELHGGTIRASSEGEGTGSTFTVLLPMAQGLREDDGRYTIEGGTAQPLHSIRVARKLAGLNILVVDDDADTCELVQFLFHRAGANVKIAMSAKRALEIMEAWNPDVLVADISMPEVDGYSLIQEIRSRSDLNAHVPAVALTALARIEDRTKALSAGYHKHVAKPIEPSELIDVVSRLAGVA